MAYEITNLEQDGTGLPEQLGTKEKFWVKIRGEDWLLKFGRPGTGENWAEKAACELARALEIPCALYDLATFDGQQCVVSRSIVPKDGWLVLGNELLARFSEGYDAALRYSQRRHTVSLVMSFIGKLGAEPPSGWCHPEIDGRGVFLGYLLLDALVGNTDRHHENWGILVRSSSDIRVAPTFDHASSLGRELNDSDRMARLQTSDRRFAVHGYVRKAKSGFYGTVPSRKAIDCVDAFYAGTRLADNAAQFWRSRLEALQKSDIERIFSEYPHGWVSESASTFAIACIEENRRRILDRFK